MSKRNTRVVRKCQDDILDYSIAVVLAIGFTITGILIIIGAATTPAIIALTIITVVTAFTITPYAVATWLNTNVNRLITTNQYSY